MNEHGEEDLQVRKGLVALRQIYTGETEKRE